ncbi:MAG: ligand-binding sensor domain-containing protein [Flavobacteriales bacterium]
MKTVSSTLPALAMLTALCTSGCTGPGSPAEKQATMDRPGPQLEPTAEAWPAIQEANVVTGMDAEVNRIFQDSKGRYWFGTNTGAYRYDGKQLVRFTTKDGMTQDQVLDIQEDGAGNIWFSTSGFGVDRADGQQITAYKVGEDGSPVVPIGTGPQAEAGDVWFAAGGGAFRYRQDALAYLPFPEDGSAAATVPRPPYSSSTYGVYVTYKDKKGGIWFGTQSMGVCRYDGRTFTWLTGKGLKDAAMRAIWEDRNGVLWFGNNGKGLIRYDGSTLTNVTDEAGLGNPGFFRSGRSGPNTLARVWAITEDPDGNLWVGTFDAGIWRYDGHQLEQFTTKDGLPDLAVQALLVDRDGMLWVGTGTGGVSFFDGKGFSPFHFTVE